MGIFLTPPPPQAAYIVYEWSLTYAIRKSFVPTKPKQINQYQLQLPKELGDSRLESSQNLPFLQCFQEQDVFSLGGLLLFAWIFATPRHGIAIWSYLYYVLVSNSLFRKLVVFFHFSATWSYFSTYLAIHFSMTWSYFSTFGSNSLFDDLVVLFHFSTTWLYFSTI